MEDATDGVYTYIGTPITYPCHHFVDLSRSSRKLATYTRVGFQWLEIMAKREARNDVIYRRIRTSQANARKKEYSRYTVYKYQYTHGQLACGVLFLKYFQPILICALLKAFFPRYRIAMFIHSNRRNFQLTPRLAGRVDVENIKRRAENLAWNLHIIYTQS